MIGKFFELQVAQNILHITFLQISTATYLHIYISHIYTVSPAGLEVPPLGPKWGRWAKKLGCASDPPIPADCRLEDQMRTRVLSPPYPTWALVGGTSRPAGETVCI